jgi:hypothetical protein
MQIMEKKKDKYTGNRCNENKWLASTKLSGHL